MRRKFKIPLRLIFILIVILIIMIIFGVFNKKGNSGQIKVLDSITDYNYTLDERDTKLMKNNYNELKKILKEKDINYEEYAKTIAKLFVIDLFTIDNKINKYDIGSFEYVYKNSVDNFKKNVSSTLYKNLIDNSNGKRKQELPVVKSVDIEDVKEDKYTIDEKSYSSYVINLTWEYERDLGYDNKATITLIKKNKFIYVVEYEAGDSNV